MDVSWQDSVASFLDSSGTDLSSFASFASGDGATLWSSSADTPFSGEFVLWESSADTPLDSRISSLSLDAVDPETTRLAGSWMDNGSLSFGGGSSSLDSGLLWAGAGDTSNPLASGSGTTGLGSLAALDLGPGNGVSQWQQLLGLSAPAETWFQQATSLLWTGGSAQPPLAPTLTTDSLRLAGSPAGPIFPTLSAERLAWTDPSAATALISVPTLADAAPTMFPRTLGVPAQSPSGLLPRLGGTP
jgi:hypothetical protein